MSFDGMFTHVMVNELNQNLSGGRISKIQQPFANELILTIRSNRKNRQLLLSAHPSYARVQITDQPFANPAKPSTFVMSLRKYITSAIVKDFHQLNNDRVVMVDLSAKNELGDIHDYTLIIEIMARHSNIFLINKENGRIIDLIKRVSPENNSFRGLLPGDDYKLPPAQNKINPFSTKDENLSNLSASDIRKKYEGIGLDTSAELEKFIANGKTFDDFINLYQNNLHPNTANSQSKHKLGFFPIAFSNTTTEVKSYATLSELLDNFYLDKARVDRIEQQTKNITRRLDIILKKDKSKVKKLHKQLDKTDVMNKYNLYGELLTTYMSKIQHGSSSITLTNYYNNEDVTIKLNPEYSPSLNAQSYYKKYRKLQNSIPHIKQQLELTTNEINYLDSVLASLEYVDIEDVDGIVDELIQSGYIKKKKKNARRKRKKKVGENFQTTNGIEITVGKNNLENDQLTMKLSQKNHYWFHVKDIPGSHVILKTSTPDEESIVQAATIAAYYSKARDSSKVPVDYVQIKHIRKPNGAKPGFVIFEGQKTVLVDPDRKLVADLKE
ncbi:Rqc2 family fibronectin-binding protein [Companilactobacillus halodurans]|uniref:Rqc2 homolog RqcH n=1 Tax=Companilactobacillus halodurans TaxID=2584183 RepID=A0A5P0ZVN3_9LACO|nr:NFACT RNA binding domain-containing protein [Companilactobacillus halodurans]MQS76382.1 fibronectin/fibrinogen-binding protein [Companilactobacillus halodurans]MQS96784.1 fibronectin/fibrinogen-binding protein [Companilactobacillus halodurans]